MARNKITYDRNRPRNPVDDTLDAQIVKDAARFLNDGEKMQLDYAVQNTLRTIGTRTSSHIVQKFGMRNALQPDHLTVKLRGSAGQSLGAFAAPGLKLEVSGDANDYVGKGLSGGTIVVRPPMVSPLVASENTIIGNTVLYGATAGYLFAAGRAGERFAVRNSGAHVVIEGCGTNGCEYMTGGVAVILGAIGANFGAGMTGGMAYLYDPKGEAAELINMETLVTNPVTVDHWETQLKGLIERHAAETGSRKAADILQHWDLEKAQFRAGLPERDAGAFACTRSASKTPRSLRNKYHAPALKIARGRCMLLDPLTLRYGLWARWQKQSTAKKRPARKPAPKKKPRRRPKSRG